MVFYYSPTTSLPLHSALLSPTTSFRFATFMRIYVTKFTHYENDYKRRGGDSVDINAFSSLEKAEEYIYKKLLSFFNENADFSFSKMKSIGIEYFHCCEDEDTGEKEYCCEINKKTCTLSDLWSIIDINLNDAEYSGRCIDFSILEFDV